MMAFDINVAARIAGSLLLTMFLAGCAAPDRRFAQDEQSCQSMGHPRGTAVFKQCMADLDARRCEVSTAQQSVGGAKGFKTHVATRDCTALH